MFAVFCGDEFALHCIGKFDGLEKCGGVKIIFARFIENPQQAMCLGFAVGLDLVELAGFQRRSIFAGIDADYKLL